MAGRTARRCSRWRAFPVTTTSALCSIRLNRGSSFRFLTRHLRRWTSAAGLTRSGSSVGTYSSPWTARSISVPTTFIVATAPPRRVQAARPNIFTRFFRPPSSRLATIASCRCRRNSSPRRTVARNRTAKVVPHDGGLQATAAITQSSTRSISATISSRASRSARPRRQRRSFPLRLQTRLPQDPPGMA